MPLTYQEIAEILKILDASTIDEFVVEVGDIKLAVRRKSAEGSKNNVLLESSKPAAPPPEARSGTAAFARRQDKTAASRAPADSAQPAADGLAQVRAPMSGIFYGKPSPDAEPFVSVGANVRKGDALCLVEVMKLYNTIRAELNGRIVEVGAEDGDLVEYDQVLFLIEPGPDDD